MHEMQLFIRPSLMAQGIETKRKCMRNHEMNIDFFRTESMNTTQGGTANAFIHHSSLHSLFPLPRMSVSPQVGFLRRMASVDVRSPDARSLHGRSLLDAWSFHGTASHGRSLRNARSSPRSLDGRPLLTSPVSRIADTMRLCPPCPAAGRHWFFLWIAHRSRGCVFHASHFSLSLYIPQSPMVQSA